ncbi:MAG: hypothetical protein PVF51_09265, partial [Nitrospirota bacterium]
MIAAMDEALFQEVEGGTVVVTATRRLAREVTLAYDAHQRARGRQAWTGCHALPLHAWLRQQWLATWPAEVVPSEAQHLALWEAVITHHLGPEAVADPVALAPLAAEGAALAVAWRLPAAAATAEEQAFRTWRTTFRQRCRELGWLDPAELPERVAEAIRQGHTPVSGPVIAAGFDHHPPAQRALWEALAAAGRPVRIPDARGAQGRMCLR